MNEKVRCSECNHLLKRRDLGEDAKTFSKSALGICPVRGHRIFVNTRSCKTHEKRLYYKSKEGKK